MKEKKEEEYLKDYSARNPLLPFDQISYPTPTSRLRNNSPLLNYMPNILKQMKARLLTQEEKLSLLQKVNDPSYEQISFKESMAEVIENAVNARLKHFRPDQNFILMWNFLILGVITYNFLEIPLSLFLTDQVYYFQLQDHWALSFNILFIIALFLDTCFVRMNLAFYRNGNLIVKRTFIFTNYLRYDFILDAISLFVYLLYIACGTPKLIYLKILFYLKLSTLNKINDQISLALATHRTRLGIYRLLRTILLLWFVTTWVSCIYFGIDYAYYQERGYYFRTGQLWLTNSNSIDNLNLLEIYPYWYVWYEYAVYWSFQTSATIGYGDMTPRNPHQVLYCNFIILINTVFFAFYINTIWQIIGGLQEYYTRYTQNWSNLKQYLSSESIHKQLSTKIDNFLQEMWINENEDYDEDELNNTLSTELKIQLLVSIRGNFFRGLPIFDIISTSFSYAWMELVKKTACFLEKQKVGSGHQIYRFRDQETFLYYLAYGKVGFKITQLGIGREIEFNNHFCAEQFVTGKKCFNDAATLSFCVMWKLSRQDFLCSLRGFPHLYYKFCELKQRLLLQEETQLCCSECLKCKSKTHNYMKCPKINRWRNKIAKPQYGFRKLERPEISPRCRYARKSVAAQKVRNVWINRKRQVDETFNYESYHVEQNLH